MTPKGDLQCVGRAVLALGMVVVMVLASYVPTARAQSCLDGTVATAGMADVSSTDPPGEPDRWWGAVGAILCGYEARLVINVPAVGMNPYVLAAGIAGCSLAALDVFTTK